MKEGQIEIRSTRGRREVGGRLTRTPWDPSLGRTEAHAHLGASSEAPDVLPRGVPGVVGRARMLMFQNRYSSMSSKIAAEWRIERRLSTKSDIFGPGRIEIRSTHGRCTVDAGLARFMITSGQAQSGAHGLPSDVSVVFEIARLFILRCKIDVC